jgi:hypothetical protein
MIIDIVIEGITPVIFDRFYDALLVGRDSGTTNRGTELTPLEQAKSKLYLDAEEKPYVPNTYIFACIIAAGRFIKVGKRQLSTRDETIIPSFLSLIGTQYPIESRSGWRVDGRGVVNPTTGGRVMCYRPMFDDWRLSFSVDLDEREGKPAIVRELVDRAGRAVGIGVMRPSRKGPYGQFKVIHWVEKRVESPVLVAAE